MKIHDISQTNQTAKPYITDKTGTNQGISFHELLESHLHRTSKPSDVNSTRQVTDVAPVPTALRLESLSLTEQTLKTLEHFENALKNNALAADNLEPIISSLEENTAALVAFKNQIDEQDPLSNLLNRVATTTYVETVKYRRGDYNAS
jgi:hypothetical protein